MVRESLSAFSFGAFSESFLSDPAFKTVVIVRGVDEDTLADSGVDFAPAAALEGAAETGAVEAAAAGVAGAAGVGPVVGVVAGSSSITANRAVETSLLRLASLLRGGILCQFVCVGEVCGLWVREVLYGGRVAVV